MLKFLHKRDFLRVFSVYFSVFLQEKAASKSWLLINAESKADHVVRELRVLYLISHAGLNQHLRSGNKSSSAGELSMSIGRLGLPHLSYQGLNLARLPIPPYGQIYGNRSDKTWTCTLFSNWFWVNLVFQIPTHCENAPGETWTLTKIIKLLWILSPMRLPCSATGANLTFFPIPCSSQAT